MIVADIKKLLDAEAKKGQIVKAIALCPEDYESLDGDLPYVEISRNPLVNPGEVRIIDTFNPPPKCVTPKGEPEVGKLSGGPATCDRCNNAIMLPGLCHDCRIRDLEVKLHALEETIREYMPVAIPKGEHELSTVIIPGVGKVPVWISVVVKTPVLVVNPSHFDALYDNMDRAEKVTIIKDEWMARGGAARSTKADLPVGAPNSVERQAWIEEQKQWWEEHHRKVEGMIQYSKFMQKMYDDNPELQGGV